MIVQMVDRNDNIIRIAGIATIHETDDNMIVMTPSYETSMINVNGEDVLRSREPSIDKRAIRGLGVLL